MKVKEITIGAGYTYQPAAYHSAKGEAHFTVEIEDGDDVDAVQEDIRQQIVNSIVHTLAGVDEVHMNIFKRGMDPKDLVKEVEQEAGDIFTDDNDEWK